MKQLLSDLFKPFFGLLLILLALVLLFLIAPFAALWKIGTSLTQDGRKPRDILTALGKYFKDIAISYDQLGNALYGGFFNGFLSAKELLTFTRLAMRTIPSAKYWAGMGSWEHALDRVRWWPACSAALVQTIRGGPWNPQLKKPK